MSAQAVALPSGRVVSLAKTWGSQSRNNCPNCQRFLASGPRVICRGCGTSYRQVDGSLYEVEASP
jgi:predicted amidophosphoribosyltransferase